MALAIPELRRSTAVVAAILVVTAGLVGVYAHPHATSEDTRPEFQFADVSSEAGFEYSSDGILETGLGDEGVYVLDFDNDQWPDVLAIGGTRPVLFENTGGQFERSGELPEIEETIQGAVVFDRDNDGWEDVLLLPKHGRGIYLENDEGTLSRTDVGLDVSLSVPVGATAADVDGDGTQDVFIAQYGEWGHSTPKGWGNQNVTGSDNGNRNVLLLNDGEEFERADDAGISGARWSLATSLVDLNDDGWPDIHVANDFNRDLVYLNRGDGTFERHELGRATDRNGMSSEVMDVDRDGKPDVFVTNIYLPITEENVSEEKYEVIERFQEFVLGERTKGNNLLVNQGDGKFSDKADEYGVRKGGWGWAAVATDFDDDGVMDLFTTTQRFIRLDEQNPTWTYPMLWRGNGERFEKLNATAVGFAETDGRGAATLDYDRDGRMDLVVANHDGPFRLYQNRIDGGNSLAVDVSSEGRPRLGTDVYVTVDGRTRTTVVNARADYQSQDSRVAHFGLGEHERVDEVRVVWPDGTEKTFVDVAANQLLVVDRDGIEDRREHERELSDE